jgi:hypothetical protein
VVSSERSEQPQPRIARRRAEEKGADMHFVGERRRSGRLRDVPAADLQEEMAEQRFSVPIAPTKTAAAQRTSGRAERAIKQGAIRRERSE